ncbi:MAG: hypothetical protein HGA51_08755 [Demequinaceae bacterium]|nr:hypothetical protein [Demequinaceae bacterium]
MTSASLADLEGRLDEVRCLTALDPKRGESLTEHPRLSAAVNRASLVLLSAHLEGYLEDIAVEAIDALVEGGAALSRLPLLFRAIHAEEHLRPLEQIKDRNARAPRIRDLFALESSLWVTGNTLTATMVRAKTVCKAMDNPGSNEVRQFLEIFGVDIRQHLRDTGNAATLGRIDGLVGKRNAIAHGEPDASATFGDVDSYVRAVGDLATEIDAAVAAAVRDVCESTVLPW